MPFLPTEKFKIETGMTREEVISRLRNVTGERRFFKLRREKPFEGEVADNGFRIQYGGVDTTWGGLHEHFFRHHIYFDDPKNRRARELDVLGSFREDGDKTVLSLNITLMPTIKVFLLGWMFVLIPSVLIWFFIQWDFRPLFMMIPAGMILFAYCLGRYVIFKSAIREVKLLLTAILQRRDKESK